MREDWQDNGGSISGRPCILAKTDVREEGDLVLGNI